MADVEQMKWWGWGGEKIEFYMDDKPDLVPYIRKVTGIAEAPYMTLPVRFEEIELPPLRSNPAFIEAVRAALRPDQVRDDKRERLVHAYGKSFRDLWRIRHGIMEAAPDCVIYPETEDDVALVVTAADRHGAALIPFGGGSNIAGSLEALSTNGRTVVSLDMKRMDKVLELDAHSCTARIQAGSMGPRMENQLRALGFTLGHFPDSFEYSSIGGWAATRSAGMQSDKYGKIEDMVLSLRMVTPAGVIVTRTVPKCSNGIDINHICIGSEGILGVITEVTVRVHAIPERRGAYGYFFPDFESGVRAMHECVRRDCTPCVSRLNDPGKTALSLAFKTQSSPLEARLARGVKWYLRNVKTFDLDKACLMLIIMEGTRKQFARQKRLVNAIYRKHGAFNLGSSPGKSFEKAKYDFPYIRDYVMDRNIMTDVSETATVWSNVLPLYYSTFRSIREAMEASAPVSFLGCHISHTYHTGASLYFTFGCQQIPGREIEQYLRVKKAAEDAFIRGGATLSHHHAVGTEHLPWIKDDISPTGLLAVRALKEGLDPNGIMNPGKVLPSDEPLRVWGLPEDTSVPSGVTAT